MSSYSGWWISSLPLRKRVITELEKAKIEYLDDLIEMTPAQLLAIRGIGPIYCQHIIDFIASLDIDPIQFFTQKLEEKGWDLFYIERENRLMGLMITLKTNPGALEVFEKKYQIKIGADIREKTGVVGQTYAHAVQDRMSAETIWKAWESRIAYIYNTLLDDIQSRYKGRILE